MMKGVFVTGGSGGIGAALVKNLREAGNEVTFTFRHREEKARELELSTGAKALRYDMADAGSVIAVCKAIRDSEVDGLVNLAADPLHRQAFF